MQPQGGLLQEHGAASASSPIGLVSRTVTKGSMPMEILLLLLTQGLSLTVN